MNPNVNSKRIVVVEQRYQVRYAEAGQIQKQGFDRAEDAKRRRDELAGRSIDAVAVDVERATVLD